ncbi:hypothetical protein Tco_0389661 [Tanacetum coccineum]
MGQMSFALVVHSSNEEPPTKKRKVVMDIPIPTPTRLNIFMFVTIDSIPYEQYTKNLFSLSSFEFSPISPSNMADKGKGIAQTFNDDKLNQEVKRLADLKAKKEKSEKKLRRLTPDQIRAQEEELATIEAKCVKMLDEYNHCINFRDDPLPITKLSYRENNASKEYTMRITRNNQPLNLKIYDKFILKMLGFNE